MSINAELSKRSSKQGCPDWAFWRRETVKNNIQVLKASASKVLHGRLMMVVPLEKVIEAEKELSEEINATENSGFYHGKFREGRLEAFREVKENE